MERIYYHITPLSNITEIARKGLTPKIGPRSSIAKETKPFVWLFKARMDVEDAICNWFGEHFPESEPMLIIELRLPESFVRNYVTPYQYYASAYEAACTANIKPQWMTCYDENWNTFPFSTTMISILSQHPTYQKSVDVKVTPVPVDVRQIAGKLNIDVKPVHVLKTSDRYCRGILERKTDKTTIFINENDSEDVKRLTIARLLSYNVCVKDRQTEETVMDGYPFKKLPNDKVVMERACCMMMPERELRMHIHQPGLVTTPYTIAEKFRMPLSAVNKRIDIEPERIPLLSISY